MNKALQTIQQKINMIQSGLLRYKQNDDQVTLQVKAASANDYSFDCITDEDVKGLHNKEVSLVQKHKDDYLYITGKVNTVVKNKKTVISISILKACWFVRESEGTLTWLEEKHMYEKESVTLRMAS